MSATKLTAAQCRVLRVLSNNDGLAAEALDLAAHCDFRDRGACLERGLVRYTLYRFELTAAGRAALAACEAQS